MRQAKLLGRIGAIAGGSLAQSKSLAAVLLLATTLVGGCVTAPPSEPKIATRPYHLSAAELEVIKRDLSESLKDPGSSIFGAIAAVEDTKGVVTVCGVVNGRNSYGGYTGKKPFTGVLGTNTRGQRVFGLAGIGSTTNMSLSVMMLCERYGLG